jgi:salicylate biosynthesis isochorismate synthase/menaquinone-specific isochorismate synthase
LTVRLAAGGSPFALASEDRARLTERVAAALRVARRERRRVIASVDVAIDAAVDVSAVVLASRGRDDRFFCLEQRDRGEFALATLGAAELVEAAGPRRFADAAAACRALGHGALTDADGPRWVGGFAFAPDGGSSPEWSSLAPAQLVLPEVVLSRQDGAARMTLTAVVDGDKSADAAAVAVAERLADRAASLRADPMPLLDPHPIERARVASAAPPEHFEAAVTRAVERINAGELSKVVLAREVRVHAPEVIDPAPIYDGLRTAFPSCYCYLVGTPELAFVGASPELLVRRDGARAQTVALAGTRRRSADPAVDRHLGEQLLSSPKDREEQAIVTRRIERTLGPVSVWVAAADEPVLVKVHNVQHLGTPIRAQLSEPIACVELAGRLHPTPAVGGEPEEKALPLIPALEGLDRGWYAGPVGWTDLAEDGEFCVALRCALLRGGVAHLYAGEGIVADSDPAQELEANEAKLQALLPLLT